jgi:hypothetical protein
MGEHFDTHGAIDEQLYGMPFEASGVISEDTMTESTLKLGSVDDYMNAQRDILDRIDATRNRDELETLNDALRALEIANPELDEQATTLRRRLVSGQ